VNAVQLLPLLRELFGRHPEYLYRQGWELQWLLYALKYTNGLGDEYEIAAAAEVAREDWPQRRPAA
jgi:hypothetical protein